MTFPDDVSEREAYILQQVMDGHYEARWHPIESSVNGHTARFWIMEDALKIDGVRVNVSATLEQQIADAIGASLLTPKLADLLHASAEVVIDPLPRPITSSTSAMLEQDASLNNAIMKVTGSLEAAKGKIVSTIGKHWVIDQQWRTTTNAINYGWHFVGQTYHGIKGYPCSSGLPYSVIQPSSTAHNAKHVDYCLSPETRVLTADLKWVPIGDIHVGSELVGFDETLHGHCRLRGSLVQATTLLEAPSFELVTSRGSVVASGEHRWPVYEMSRGLRRASWVATRALQSGSLIPYLCQPWEQDTSWDAAWMAGFLDGNGWLDGTCLSFCQNPVELLDRALGILGGHAVQIEQAQDNIGRTRVNIDKLQAVLRVLGIFRPVRLMSESRAVWDGHHAYGDSGMVAEVLEVRPLGNRDVVGVQTSTNTLVAEGLLSHNSQVCVLVLKACLVDGQLASLADVLTSPDLAPLASHNGPLSILRQPGVPEPQDRSVVLPEIIV